MIRERGEIKDMKDIKIFKCNTPGYILFLEPEKTVTLDYNRKPEVQFHNRPSP